MEKRNDFRVKKVAVVCHNYNVRNRYGPEDYSEHFSDINQICDNNGCDTVLYALFTWDKKSPAVIDHQSIFHNLRNVQCIMIEGVCDKFMRAIFMPPPAAPKNLPNGCSEYCSAGR